MAVRQVYGNRHTALCPFHQEKTPSFSIRADKDYYKCFGCGSGGDVFRFVMEERGVPFQDALAILAEIAGVNLGKVGKHQEERSRIIKINKAAAEVWHQSLLKTPMAMKYLASRGVTKETIKEFHLGLAGASAPDLLSAVKKTLPKITMADLEMANIISSGKDKGGKEDKYVKFYDRIIIPIHDIAGRVLGFTGRVFKPGSDEKVKYLNTSGTHAFKKSDSVFNLDKAKTRRGPHSHLIVVEGHMDAIAMYQAGFKNVVAAGGTAINDNTFYQLAKYTDSLKFIPDTDSAGQKAMLELSGNPNSEHPVKGILIDALRKGFSAKVVTLSDAKDADEAIKKDRNQFKDDLAKAVPAMEYIIERLCSVYDASTGHGKHAIGKIASYVIMLLPSPIEQEYWGSRLAKRVGVPLTAIKVAFTKWWGNLGWSGILGEQPWYNLSAEEYYLGLFLAFSKELRGKVDILGDEAFSLRSVIEILPAARRFFNNGVKFVDAGAKPEQIEYVKRLVGHIAGMKAEIARRGFVAEVESARHRVIEQAQYRWAA